MSISSTSQEKRAFKREGKGGGRSDTDFPVLHMGEGLESKMAAYSGHARSLSEIREERSRKKLEVL